MSTLNKQRQGKTWWSPIWRGLVVDPKARHYKQMGKAIWLFVYFLIHADRKTGELWRKHNTISSDMGVNVRTIRRWQERLCRHRYITLNRTGRSQVICIQKWKALQARRTVNSDPKSGQTGTG